MLKRLSPLPYLPGLSLALALAFLATWLARFIPFGIISASVIALFLGMVLRTFKQPNKQLQHGIGFASKRLLKIAIVLLGASLDITTIMQVGSRSLMIMVFTLATCFGVGHFVGKALHLNWKMSNLISAGTGICGGSAIAALAPVIDAEDRDIAFALSATFLFDMVMILLFPLMGQTLGMTDTAYGLWAGTAVNDTSSVVAAGYGFSEAAGDYAVMVKLTRTLAIIPTVLVFGAINFHASGVGKSKKGQVKASIPYFIVLFLVMAGLNSLGIIPESLSAMLKTLSKFLMVTALAAIGLKTSLGDLRTSGGAAMFHGFIISLLVVVVAYLVIYAQQEVLFLI